MGLGHKWISREIDLSEFFIYYTRPDSVEGSIKELGDFIQEGLNTYDTWDEYFDLKVKTIVENLAKGVMKNSNYHRYLIDITNLESAQGQHIKVEVHFYLHPLFDTKETFSFELKSKDYVE